VLIDLGRSSPKLSCADDIKRAVGDFRDGLSREGFPAPWVAIEQTNETFTLADYDVVKVCCLRGVLPDECTDELLLFLAEDELAEGFIGPDNIEQAFKSKTT